MTAAPSNPTLRTLLLLAWPIIISRASQVVVGVSDAAMVSDLGEAALAATTTGGFNAWALMILPMGVTFIVSSFASQLFGKGDLVGARRYGIYGLFVAVGALVMALLTLPFVPAALSLFSFGPDVRALMTDYLQWRLPSVGAAIGIEALGNYYGGIGNTRRPMIANVVAMALNVVGNWILIGGHLGAPALGVKGAALASSLATLVAFLGLLAFFIADGRRLGKPAQGLSMKEFLRMLRFGLPSGFNWFFEFFAFNFFINVVVAGLGTTALAAMMVAMQINSVSFMPAFGLASAGAILVGQAIGKGRKDDVPGLVRLTFSATGSYQGLVGLSYLLIPGLLIGAFAQAGAAGDGLRAVGSRMLMLSAAWQLFDSAATALSESLRAAGDTSYTLWARILIAWGIFVPGSYLTVVRGGGGDVVAMVWVVSYLALLALVLFLRFRGGAWRRIELVDPTAQPLV